MTDPILSREELALADATGVAEMLDIYLEILQLDVQQILDLAHLQDDARCAGLTIALLALTAKMEQMRAQVAPLLNSVVGREAMATRERTVERVLEGSPESVVKDFGRIFAQTFSLNMMPQIVAPIYEQATNKNSFTGAAIETPGMENEQPFLRAGPNTIETLKALGMATRDLPEGWQINPVRTQALIRGYFNTWGMYALMLADQAIYGDKLPAKRADELPIVRRFYESEPAQHTKYEQQFYDLLGQAQRLHGTLRALDRMGRSDLADQKEQDPLAGESKPLDRAAKNLSDINKEMVVTRRDQSMTPEEKRARLDELTRERNDLLKRAVQDAQSSITSKAGQQDHPTQQGAQ